MFYLVCVSFLIASISYTVTRAFIFKPFRDFSNKYFHAKIAYLFSCFYCFSYWVSFFTVWYLNINLFDGPITIINYFFSAIVISWMSCLSSALFQVILAARNNLNELTGFYKSEKKSIN